MYHSLLSKVITVINTTVAPNAADEMDELTYTYLFSPEVAQEAMERKRKKRNKANTLITVATGMAVIGEGFHIAKRSGLIDKVFKK